MSIILVRPQHAGNIGSVARAMKNMGLDQLRLVSPQENPTDLTGIKMAMGGRDILEGAQSYSQLGEAIADLDLVVGTSRRFGQDRQQFINVREFAEWTGSLPEKHRVGILFGTEVTGLTNEEIAHCQKVITIPTASEDPSLNLAQAVLVVAYELFMAPGGEAFTAPPGEEAKAATVGDFENMIDDWKSLLDEAGFLDQQNPDHLMRILRQLFNRARLSDKEVRIFRGICRQLRWWKENK
ncbi:MAG: RNA methyltransferase [bacterium]|nr:RNA methyltransferase [bacterium]